MTNKFLKWCKQNMIINGIQIKHISTEKGKGVISIEAIKKDTIVLKIPRELYLQPYKYKQTICINNTNLKLCNIKLPCSLDNIGKIALSLLLEKRKKQSSFYREWLEILPLDNQRNFLINMNDEKIQKCKLLKDIKLAKECVLREHYDIVIRINNTITFNEYKWAYYIVLSRYFGEYRGPYLYPFADFINHSDDNNLKVIWSENYIEFKTIRDVNINEELCINYGIKSMLRYICNYGFVPNKTVSVTDIYVFPTEINYSDIELKNVKMKILKTMNIRNVSDSKSSWDMLLKYRNLGDNIRFEIMKLYDIKEGKDIFTTFHSTLCLFGLLRFLYADNQLFIEKIIPIFNRCQTNHFMYIPILSLENEMCVLKYIKGICFKNLHNTKGELHIIKRQQQLLFHYMQLCDYIIKHIPNKELITSKLKNTTKYLGYYNIYWKEYVK